MHGKTFLQKGQIKVIAIVGNEGFTGQIGTSVL